MQCPKCGNDKLKILDTRHAGSGIKRTRLCWDDENSIGCGKQFETYEKITTVKVYDPNKMRNVKVDEKEYKDKHKDNEIKGSTGFQQKMYD